MKLELARAMLYNADLLLLDEVCTFMTIFSMTEADSISAAYKSCA